MEKYTRDIHMNMRIRRLAPFTLRRSPISDAIPCESCTYLVALLPLIA